MRINFESFSALQYRNRALSRQVEEFKSGEKYVKMEADYKKLQRFHNQEIKRLEHELAKAHSETVTVRKYWSEVMDDLDKEHQAEVRRLLARIERLEKEKLGFARQRDAAKDKLRERTQQYYAAASELEEERGKNKKLTAQVNRDFENSSIPSSKQKAGKKRIPNSREKTGKKPGGQPGHKGHARKQHKPDVTYEIPALVKYTDNPDYYETGKMIHKQKISIILNAKIIEYVTKEYRNRKTGARVHAPFPEGYVNEVNYDGTGHQECTQHDIRCLIGSVQNEAELEWNKQMLELFRKMLHYRNGLSENESLSPSIVSGFEDEYDRILETAEKEYADEPPSDYYREGYNLFVRLRKYKENELLFLYDKRVPANNSLCERLARVYKRKQKQAVTLRSQENLCCICDGLSIVYLLRSKEENVYQKIAEIYDREHPPKSKEKTDATA